jgi:hypothetical protein
MLAGVQHDQHIQLRPQINKIGHLGIARVKFHLSVRVHIQPAEKIDVRHEVALAEAAFAEFDQKIIMRVAIPVIALFLVGGLAIFAFNQRGVAVAAERIVPAHAISSD